MKKLFFWLLIIAAGAGAFFLFQKKQTRTDDSGIQTELIVGKWKLNSLSPKDSNSALPLIMMLDSNLMNYQYEFNKQGNLLLSLGDSLSADSARYEWNKDHQLVLKGNQADTTAEIMNVAILNMDSLQLVDNDSTLILFTRLK